MVDRRFHLTEAADAGLERLYEWGIDRFGVNSADEYYEGLIARLVQIADTPQLWQEVDHIRAGYRVRCMSRILSISGSRPAAF